MSIGVGLIPMVLVPLTFLFVLLIILIVRSPKAGVWALGGLVLAAALLFWRLAATRGMPSHGEAIPLFIVPLTFLFVLLVILLAKAPKLGAGLIIALVCLAVLGLLLIVPIRHRRVVHVSEPDRGPVALVVQQSEHGAAGTVVDGEFDRVFEHYVQPPAAAVESRAAISPSPIWSEGVEKEFRADIYPSRSAAVRALGERVDKPVREVTTGDESPRKIVLFQQQHERDVIAEFANGLREALPETAYTVEADIRNIQSDELAIVLQFVDLTTDRAPWARSAEVKVASGGVEVTVSTPDRRATLRSRFVDKPWIEDFARFASTNADQHFMVARSLGTCTGESEASEQALAQARAQVAGMLDRQSARTRARLPQPQVTTEDLFNGHLVVDRFAQSFDGSSGKIWRYAVLIDASAPKLARLADQKAREARSMRMTWARMGFSVIGVLVVIGVIYFFLNMATRGYYEWSLRIAGVILAIVAIVSVLMIVQ